MRIRTNYTQTRTNGAVWPQANHLTDMNQLTRISIVEDTHFIANELKEGLKAYPDIEFITHYDNGEDAAKGLLKDKPDVVIMDIELPQMNGIECMVKVLNKDQDIQFMMFTVFESSDSLFDSLKSGALGYILKRDGVVGVVNGIRELREGGSPMSRSIARKVLKSFQQPKELMEQLSPRELQVLNLLSKGLQYKEIAVELNPQIIEGTVRQHVHRIYKKLQVNNRVEAVNKYLGRN